MSITGFNRRRREIAKTKELKKELENLKKEDLIKLAEEKCIDVKGFKKEEIIELLKE